MTLAGQVFSRKRGSVDFDRRGDVRSR